MGWHATDVSATKLTEPQLRAGDEQESVLQPGFTSDSRLFALSDRNGYWQLGELTASGWQQRFAFPADAAVAPWSLGMRTWCEGLGGAIWLIVGPPGHQQVWRVSIPNDSATVWQTSAVPSTHTTCAPHLACSRERVFLLASSTQQAEALLALRMDTLTFEDLRVPLSWPVDVAIAPAQTRTAINAEQSVPYFAYFPLGVQSPPLLVLCHSGPTGAASPHLQASIQFWTSRGFAVADVNYRGSDGFGRQWRQSLLGHWGEYDVADCLTVIEQLASSGEVDADRIYLRGNSAGGLTVLHLLTRTTLIRAAAVRYPVVDLQRLATSSHKFEAQYLSRLVGGESGLAMASPTRTFHLLRTPLLIQQGDLDAVVPLEQAQRLAEALTYNRVDHELLVHMGEGHGFRRADSLRLALEAEWWFFARHA